MPVSGGDRRHATSAGFTLIELLIALAIGAFLVIGAVQVYLQGSAAYRATVEIARLQENARFAIAALAPDVRMAGYWGLTAQSGSIAGKAGRADPVGPVPAAADCGHNWAIDIDHPISGWNNVWAWTCTPRGTRAAGSDSFVIRRAGVPAIAPPLATNAVYIETNRMGSGRLFAGSNGASGHPTPHAEIHELIVSGYYVSENSVLDAPGNPVPSLRRKVLQGLRIVDEEVMPGVEDMQIQLGIDTSAPGAIGRGSANRFVNADDPSLDPTSATYDASARVVAVRIWLRLRTEFPERGFTDARIYRYADRDYRPAGNERSYRRIVVSRTFYLRNAAMAP